MGGAPPPPPGLASPDPKSDHFFRHFSGVFGGPPGPPKTVKNDPPDPQKRPPGDLPGTPQKPPKKGGFWGVFGGFSGGILGSPEGGFSGVPEGPRSPRKGSLWGRRSGGSRRAAPRRGQRGWGGYHDHYRATAQTERPWSDVLRRCTPKAELQGNGSRVPPPSRISNETTPDKKNFEHHHDITMTCQRHHDDMQRKKFCEPPATKNKIIATS